MLENTNEDFHASLLMIEAAKMWLKPHYDSHFHLCTFNKGNLILIYDQYNDKTRKGNLESMFYGPYIIHRCLNKGAYLLVDSDGHLLKNPHNGLYLKRFYA